MILQNGASDEEEQRADRRWQVFQGSVCFTKVFVPHTLEEQHVVPFYLLHMSESPSNDPTHPAA